MSQHETGRHSASAPALKSESESASEPQPLRQSPSHGLSGWLIHRAAARAPQDLSERLEEEWLADLADRPTGLSRVRFAVGCAWATRVIAFEHRLSGVAALGTIGAAKLLSLPSRRDFGRFSRPSSTVFMVIGLHAVVFYALMTGLGYTHVTIPRPPLENQALKEARTRPELLPIPKPSLDEVRLRVPPLDFPTVGKSDPSTELTTSNDRDPLPPAIQPQPSPEPPHVVKQVQGGAGPGFPNAEDFYPSLSRHLEEQGVVAVRVCVDTSGRLTADPTTLQGSGSSRLDDGALQLARAASGHYRASTEDGRPVNSCYPLRIRFQLRN